MDLLIIQEGRFARDSNGFVRTNSPFTYSFWSRYLSSFSSVTVAARMASEVVDSDWPRADGPGVVFADLPYYQGFGQFLRVLPQTFSRLDQLVAHSTALLLRVPSPLASLALFRHSKRTYGVEVVGDPFDTFAPGATKHPLREFFRRYLAKELRSHCTGAAAGSYVTKEALQRRYPLQASAWSTHYSSVELPDTWFAEYPRAAPRSGNLKLVHVGTLEQLYKGTDVLLHALARAKEQGAYFHLTVVGDGIYRADLERLAAQLNIDAEFVGHLPSGSAIRDALDKSDVFVLPSRQEGLPRALLEAMARGMPCLASSVGGIPEILPRSAMVEPANIQQLSDAFVRINSDRETLDSMAKENLSVSFQYRNSLLSERRTMFYRKLRDLTEHGISTVRHS